VIPVRRIAGITDPGYNAQVTSHKHLKRLSQIWIDRPIYFITTCSAHRRPIFANEAMASILIEEWTYARARHGWAVGGYVIMEDHVHFFCRAELDAKPLHRFLQRWKEWTAKRALKTASTTSPVWQPEFFDHVLRSSESYSQKWYYVRENPVRAGLVEAPDDWRWQGEIENLMF